MIRLDIAGVAVGAGHIRFKGFGTKRLPRLK